MNLRHIGVTVVDMEKSLKLYKDYFGFNVVWDELEQGDFIDNLSDEKQIKVRTVKMKDTNGGMVELLQYYSHPGTTSKDLENHIDKIMKVGCSHFALTVNNVDKTYNELKKMGLKFNCKPQVSPNSKAKVCFCRDFDGTLIELVEEL